jgi:hypothetical protein
MTIPIAKKFNEYMKFSNNEDLKRIFNSLATGSTIESDEEQRQISKLHSTMEQIYSTTKVCEPNDEKKCYTLTPYLERTMQIEKDYERLIWAWQGWYDGCGNQIRSVYLPYIDLLNENAKKNGYQDLSVSGLIFIWKIVFFLFFKGFMDCRL